MPEVRGKGSAGEGQAMTQQFAWRASLVVILLIVSVGIASAECAWVDKDDDGGGAWTGRPHGGRLRAARVRRDRNHAPRTDLDGAGDGRTGSRGGVQPLVQRKTYPGRAEVASRLSWCSPLPRPGRRWITSVHGHVQIRERSSPQECTVRQISSASARRRVIARQLHGDCL